MKSVSIITIACFLSTNILVAMNRGCGRGFNERSDENLLIAYIQRMQDFDPKEFKLIVDTLALSQQRIRVVHQQTREVRAAFLVVGNWEVMRGEDFEELTHFARSGSVNDEEYNKFLGKLDAKEKDMGLERTKDEFKRAVHNASPEENELLINKLLNCIDYCSKMFDWIKKRSAVSTSDDYKKCLRMFVELKSLISRFSEAFEMCRQVAEERRQAEEERTQAE